MEPCRVATVEPSSSYGLWLYSILCVLAGFVIGLCLDRMFDLVQDWEGSTPRCQVSTPTDRFCTNADLDTAHVRFEAR